jgi:hypothetical protein
VAKQYKVIYKAKQKARHSNQGAGQDGVDAQPLLLKRLELWEPLQATGENSYVVNLQGLGTHDLAANNPQVDEARILLGR